jgi:glycosyltransferase involved in cell wall biosynthesis
VIPVSVIIPCRDEKAEHIAETVYSAMQAGSNDIVVVDDGSESPQNVPVAEGVRAYYQRPRGIASALNHGAMLAKHDWICWLSVRDTMYEGKLELQLRETKRAEALASFHDYINAITGLDVSPLSGKDWREHLRKPSGDNQICGSTTMVHREVIARIGGWDTSLQYCVDRMFAKQVEYDTGWHHIPLVLGSAGEHLEGHTYCADMKKRNRDSAMVVQWAEGMCREVI